MTTSNKLKLALFILLLAGMAVGAKIVGLATINAWMQTFIHYVQGLGWWGMLLYVVVFGIVCLLALPAMPLTIGAGIIFHFWIGVIITILGLALGASLGFLTSRYLARGIVAEKLKDSPKFKAIDTAIGNEGWKIVTLLRMCPLPFGLSNYIYGITSIPFWHYLVATVAGVLPSTAFFVYLGHAGQAGLDSASTKSPALLLPLGLGLIAGIACLFYVGKVARQAVAKATRETPIAPPEMIEIDPS
ncbi:MAG: TVP38/TMEM64 family protein [Chthoniobacterales bacterium]